MSTERKIKKGVIPPPPPKTNFTIEEAMELQEMQRMINGRKFEASQIGGNTALVPRGQEIAKELDAIVRLLENSKNLWISQKLKEHGYQLDEKCSVNLSTGEVMIEPPAPVLPTEAASGVATEVPAKKPAK